MKIKKIIILENIESNELSLVFSKIVSKGLCCDKVWGISIFPSCTPIRGIYRKSLLIWLRVSCCESRLPAYAVPDLDLEIKGGGREVRSKGRQLYLQGTKLLALAITSGGQRRLFVNVIVIFNATLDYIIS